MVGPQYASKFSMMLVAKITGWVVPGLFHAVKPVRHPLVFVIYRLYLFIKIFVYMYIYIFLYMTIVHNEWRRRKFRGSLGSSSSFLPKWPPSRLIRPWITEHLCYTINAFMYLNMEFKFIFCLQFSASYFKRYSICISKEYCVLL